MKTLEEVRSQLVADEFDLSGHATLRMAERYLARADIRQAGANAEVLEEYPDDKYGPSCLLLGFTESGRPLHFQVSVEDSPLVKVITAYEPDPRRWRNHRERIL